ncbi:MULTISPECIES: LETM1-related biofilm-associated protein [Flavobacterium]|uniref:Letm1 RBD domain-containing protein n=1 Tax=Flavobacterium hankyongi TaxID=1176532 RepID=A0ABP8ZYL2_9FLAO|nr:LETM1-related biofilm-associated protein [Flavobacterium sp. N1846]
MINPSAHGWVSKFFFEQNSQEQFNLYDFESFYVATRKTGFLVGYATHFVTTKEIETKGLTTEEISKIALLNSLFGVFQIANGTNNSEAFVHKCIAFYKELHPKNSGLLDIFLPTDSPESKLEKIIANRIKTNDNIISKNFSHILTNALLFVDVLAFKRFIEEDSLPKKYLKKIEEIIVSVVSIALNTKETKSNYDDLLQKLFESSVRYSKFEKSAKETSLDNIDFSYLDDDYERYYLIDIANMALWNDGKIESSEKKFLYNLANQLEISSKFAESSIHDMDIFLTENKSSIPYFNYSNPVKHFYDQTTSNVQTLVQRNKTRLLLEISQSKELMTLLRKSASEKLTPEEKKKVRNQILDICKSIPSLTIFLVPGGSLLLPILIKFIPQLLPSAFNENLSED